MRFKFLSLFPMMFLFTSCFSNVDGSNLNPANHNSETTGEYDERTILVKTNTFDENDFECISYEGVTPLSSNGNWYKVRLKEGIDINDSIEELNNTNKFLKVEYDYVMKSDGSQDDVAGNPNVSSQDYLETLGIYDAWDYMETQGISKGGSKGVVVAVIDTGVDYNHLDLRDNIWTNSAEIPNNGIDDDGNGYVDDYYGWNCVANTNDPMDDNGHGTHVAGIIAAENNDIGTVGIAYNCQIMCIKAGNSSGYFNNSDIAEAIQYAYMNGASVINMSFGGSSLSSVVEDALTEAYNSCVLVAAAGNDSACNNLACYCSIRQISYPAALPYVMGVMSSNSSGTSLSSFSNYDHYPNNSIEYEILAPGEQILSTWPNNKANTLSGTSMASPVVAGVAALLRSTLTDRDVYSTKYILSQIINNGKELYGGHNFLNAYDALIKYPKPSLALYDYYSFDNVEFSSKNNGNGIVEAGETIRLAIEVQNKGGVASDVVAKIDTIRNGDESITDPYFNIVTNTINLSDVGTYSVRDCEKTYADGVVTGTNKYFEIIVSDDCPNDYVCNFNLHLSCSNGLDESDTATYKNDDSLELSISNGYILPELINESTTFTKGKKYILAKSCVIPQGVSVTFEAGCEIQFYASSKSYYGSDGIYNSPQFTVYGKLNFNGTPDEMIVIKPSEIFLFYGCCLDVSQAQGFAFEFVDSVNLILKDSKKCFQIKNSILRQEYQRDGNVRFAIFKDGYETYGFGFSYFTIGNIYGSYIECKSYGSELWANEINGCYIETFSGNSCNLGDILNLNNSVIKSEVCFDFPYADFAKIKNSENNVFFCDSPKNAADCLKLKFDANGNHKNNHFSQNYKVHASQVIDDYYGSSGNPIVDINGECSDYETLYPFIKNIDILDKDGNVLTKVGTEEFTLRVTFSRSMDTSHNPNIYFGSVEPYADYKIGGSYTSSNVWEGKYTIKSFIEGGTQHFKIDNAYTRDDASGMLKQLADNSGCYSFDIDTTSAMSMNLNAYSTDTGVNLQWIQDDYDTLMGYNVYRSTEKDGNYTRLNTSVIPANTNTFLDDNAEPGVTYWYTFTVVLSDMSESKPAGKVMCTMKDTIHPTIYHTPVNQGYTNNNLVISCTASDNIEVKSVTLYYRTAGAATYKSLTMSKLNSKFSATILSNELTTDGIEYYIVADDGTNLTYKGTADDPYKVTIKDSSAIAIKGDVDGDGQITTKDALMIIKAINGDLLLSDDEFKKADLNGDGGLSSVEALRILQYINGNVTSLDM